MRTKLLLVGAVIAVCGAGLLLVRTPALKPPTTAPLSKEIHTGGMVAGMPAAPTHTLPSATATTTSNRTYTFIAEATGTVESLMQTQRALGSLTFTSKEYPTLGSFLESLQGTKNGNGKYWMLYINGSLSSVGMSHADVVPGDRIEWHYE